MEKYSNRFNFFFAIKEDSEISHWKNVPTFPTSLQKMWLGPYFSHSLNPNQKNPNLSYTIKYRIKQEIPVMLWEAPSI